jgi:fluoride exporter
VGAAVSSCRRAITEEVDDAMRYASISVGAMLGANLRYVVANWAADRWGGDLPYGTFLINVTGAFVIGVFLALITDRLTVNPLWRLFFATGFLGGYTTFSSYTWEALILAQTGAWRRAGAYLLGSNAVGLIGVWVGASLTRLLPF